MSNLPASSRAKVESGILTVFNSSRPCHYPLRNILSFRSQTRTRSRRMTWILLACVILGPLTGYGVWRFYASDAGLQMSLVVAATVALTLVLLLLGERMSRRTETRHDIVVTLVNGDTETIRCGAKETCDIIEAEIRKAFAPSQPAETAASAIQNAEEKPAIAYAS